MSTPEHPARPKGTDLAALEGGLIVSCQARAENALHGPAHMSAAARAAARGGAAGIRAEGAADIAAIRAVVEIPVIGIRKRLDGRPVYLTPDFESARTVVSAGADIVALDATLRPREGEPARVLIARIREELGVPVMADIDDVAAAESAAEAGADLIATTLAGYTGGAVPSEPDLALVSTLARRLTTPIVAEGRIWSPDQVTAAFDAGAWAVVVGTAITNPERITARFAARAQGGRDDPPAERTAEDRR